MWQRNDRNVFSPNRAAPGLGTVFRKGIENERKQHWIVVAFGKDGRLCAAIDGTDDVWDTVGKPVSAIDTVVDAKMATVRSIGRPVQRVRCLSGTN